jgi:type VI secretion system Hcp family effector
MFVLVHINGTPGESKVAGYLDQIVCVSFSLEVDSPRDPATGQPKGGAVHSPLQITKEWDRASLKLAQMLVTQAPFALDLTCVQATGPNLFEPFKLKLTNARVVEYQQSANDGGSQLPAEQVRFSYDTVEYTIKPPPK